MRKAISVLVVEDSLVMRELMVEILEGDPDLEVIEKASDGKEVLKLLEEITPQVILMDVYMPRMNGLEATRKIMATKPLPIVLTSANWNYKAVETSFQALEAGAVAVAPKPVGPDHKDYEKLAREVREIVKSMSEVRVVRRWKKKKKEEGEKKKKKREDHRPFPRSSSRLHSVKIQAVLIGGSTGAPPVFRRILSALPAGFPFPIIAVQHMACGFLDGFVEWLSEECQLEVCKAEKGEKVERGKVYFIPDGFEGYLKKGGVIGLRKCTQNTDCSHCPSVARLFESGKSCWGEEVAAILLSGMGDDGARELKSLKEVGAMTIIQKESSCVVFGMPGAARELKGERLELTPEEIASWLIDIANCEKRSEKGN